VTSAIVSLLAFNFFGRLVIRRAIAMTSRADLDHRMKPNKAQGINQDGLRCAFEAENFSDQTLNIIFLGDSFAYGWDLDPTIDPFPQLVEKRIAEMNPPRPVRTINFGWVSSSPLLSDRLLRDVGKKYRPSLVILCLDLTDFHDDLRYAYGDRDDTWGATPLEFVVDRIGLGDVYAELVRRWELTHQIGEYFGTKALLPVDRFFIVNQPLDKSRPFTPEIEKNILHIWEYCKEELRTKFILVMLPRNIQYTDRESPHNREARMYKPLGPYVLEPLRWLDEFKKRVEFPCHSLLDDFKNATEFPLCFDDDPHWNEAGHRIAAQGIIRILRQEGYVK
jgi:hypothetical protein